MSLPLNLDGNDHDALAFQTSADHAATSIRELILEGSLAPGAPLRQDELARQLGVSRTPLRTALAALSRDGLVEYSANRGYRVRSFAIEDIRAAFEVRSTLEALACRIAGRLGLTPGALDALGAAVAEGDSILSSGKLEPARLAAYRRMNVTIHSTIIEAAENPWLKDFVSRTHDVPMASDRIILWEDYDIILRSHDDHHRILHALRQGDGERAGRLMQEHVIFAGEVLMGHLAARRDEPLQQGQAIGFSSSPKDPLP
ncbi:GntR family transcriptional regulator [Phreatobacter sp. HK31-P]